MRAWLFYPLALVVAAFAFGAVLSVYPDLPTAPPADMVVEQTCYPVEPLQAALARAFEQRVAFSGTAAEGVGVTLFMSADGNWTLAFVDADGAACLVASGSQGRIPSGPVFIPLIPEDPA